MKRFHLSNTPKLKLTQRLKPNGGMKYKPFGFWYDVNMDWIRWLLSEEYENNPDWMRPYLYEVEVDTTRMLLIRNQEELAKFTDQYRTVEIVPGYKTDYTRTIDWDLVKGAYTGVEIAPYIWKCRLAPQFFWYYGWDCASGVVFDISTVKRLKLVASTAEKVVKLYRDQYEEREDKNYAV